MSTFPTEIVPALITPFGSILIYLFTTFIQQRTKKNYTLRLIGTVYGPLRYFLEVRYISVVILVSYLTYVFLIVLLLLLDFFFHNNLFYPINIISIISFISLILLIYFIFKLWIKRNQTIRELIEEISAYITVDIDSLTLRWKALYWGTLVLAEKYFSFIFIVIISTTLALSFLNKGFTVLGIKLLGVYLISFILSLGLVNCVRFVCLRPNHKRQKVSFFDTGDEIESRLFNLIKIPSLCLCIVDDSGNKHCGSLEGITYSVLIRDMGGILVGIPYDRVYRVEECKVKDNNT